jgi:serine/threonine-protein kinase
MTPAARLWQEWRLGGRPDVRTFLASLPDVSPGELAAVLRVDQRERWLQGDRVPAEEYVRQVLLRCEEDDPALDLSYADFLLRQELGESPTLEEYLRRFPRYAGPLRLQVQLNSALAAFPSGGPTVPLAPPPAPAWPMLPGYRIVGVLGRGGMGVVYRAWQEDLRRLVAVKMIRGGDPSGEHLARFEAEYRVLARLRHPNVVQIYEVGEHNGQPYFALELVDGGSLDQALARTPQPPRQLAELVAALARAVHAAHLQGVIHRDLKPANILLQTQTTEHTDHTKNPPENSVAAGMSSSVLGSDISCGSCVPWFDCLPKITDFGLAKQLPAGPPDSSADFRTLPGAILGTPNYLAPEQTTGNTRAVTLAVDVYSLGAILYEMLTGYPPFRGASVMEILEQVRSREPTPPRQLQPGVPRDLETICLKCLQKEPGKRYVTAAALADDLECFLQGRPIRARRTSIAERGRKWARRHPGVAVLSLALLSVVLGLAGLGVWSYLRIGALLTDAIQAKEAEAREKTAAQEQAEKARINEEEARQKGKAALRSAADASRKYRIACSVVDLFCTHVSEARLLHQPGMEALRKQLLEDARKFYDKFNEESDDPAIELERAMAYLRLAQLTAKLDSLERALPLYDEGIKLLTALREGDHRLEIAKAYRETADVQSQTRQVAQAETNYRKAITIEEEVRHADPDNEECLHGLSFSWHNLGLLLYSTNRPGEAEQAYWKSLAVEWPLIEADPSNLLHQRSLAMTLTEMAYLYCDSDHPARAEEPCRKALAVNRALQQKAPGNLDYQIDLGRAEISLGVVCLRTRQLTEAAAAFERAVAVFERLVREHPAILEGKKGLATACNDLGPVYEGLGHKERAGPCFRRAAALYAELAQIDPENLEIATGLAASQGNVARTCREQGKNAEALDWFGRSVATLEDSRAPDTNNPLALQILMNSYADRSHVLTETGRHAEGRADWQRAVKLAGGRVPPAWRVARALALARSGEHASAVAEARALASLKEPLPGMFYDLACVHSLCLAAAQKDTRLSPAQRAGCERQNASWAMELLKRAEQDGTFGDPKMRAHLRDDPDLATLRDRDDFKAWQAGLEKDER